VMGPVILFGAGGIAVEVLRDTAVALPPLDAALATDLISRTRVAALLRGYRDQPQADMVAIQRTLIALSHLIEDFPCLQALDINPLLAGPEGAAALDARIEIDPDDIHRPGPNPNMAIRPYPGAWRREVMLKGARYVLRPIRPADALLYTDFFAHLDPEDVRMRFMAPRKYFSEAMALRLTQLDYDRDMAFVALDADGALLGVSRVACDPDHVVGEYALIVRSDSHGRGLGSALMRVLIDYARADGVSELEGMILAENRPMQALVRRLGFSIEPVPEDRGVVMSRLPLA